MTGCNKRGHPIVLQVLATACWKLSAASRNTQNQRQIDRHWQTYTHTNRQTHTHTNTDRQTDHAEKKGLMLSQVAPGEALYLQEHFTKCHQIHLSKSRSKDGTFIYFRNDPSAVCSIHMYFQSFIKVWWQECAVECITYSYRTFCWKMTDSTRDV